MYSQRNEEEIILNYFKKETLGILLSIGENDGRTLSNSRALIEKGWSAILVEPAIIPFQKLSDLYFNNKRVRCYNVAIGTEEAYDQIFYESGTHLNKGDTGLLSTLKKSETERWKGTKNKFTETKTIVWDFEKLYASCGRSPFKFISIDAEGLDIDILKQINLTEVCCKCLCIEYNGIHKDYQEIKDYCMQYGLKEIHQTYENLILAI